MTWPTWGPVALARALVAAVACLAVVAARPPVAAPQAPKTAKALGLTIPPPLLHQQHGHRGHGRVVEVADGRERLQGSVVVSASGRAEERGPSMLESAPDRLRGRPRSLSAARERGRATARGAITPG